MPQKITRKNIVWKCEKCFREYDSRLKARECEKQKPKKALLTKDYLKTDHWEVGDLVVYGYSNGMEWMLGIITGTKEEYHDILPIIESLDQPNKDFSSYSFRSLILLSEDMKRKVKAWAEIIETRPDRVA